MKLYPSILMVLVLPTSALCGWQNEVTTLKPGPFLKKLQPVHLSFELNWDGKINSGNLNLLFDRKDSRYPHYIITQIFVPILREFYQYFEYYHRFDRESFSKILLQ